MTGGKSEVEAMSSSIGSLLDELETKYPGMKERLCDDQGELRRFVNIYVNEEDIRFLDGKETKIREGDEVSIIPAIAGGN
tara:strand:+ start:2756 stop:2995 length:240 start_codon:yes stop_codon:yes gene_type:complete